MTMTIAPERVPRCRMLNRQLNRCPNPVLDPDPKAAQICVAHAARVMTLVAEQREAARTAGRTT